MTEKRTSATFDFDYFTNKNLRDIADAFARTDTSEGFQMRDWLDAELARRGAFNERNSKKVRIETITNQDRAEFYKLFEFSPTLGQLPGGDADRCFTFRAGGLEVALIWVDENPCDYFFIDTKDDTSSVLPRPKELNEREWESAENPDGYTLY